MLKFHWHSTSELTRLKFSANLGCTVYCVVPMQRSVEVKTYVVDSTVMNESLPKDGLLYSPYSSRPCHDVEHSKVDGEFEVGPEVIFSKQPTEPAITFTLHDADGSVLTYFDEIRYYPFVYSRKEYVGLRVRGYTGPRFYENQNYAYLDQSKNDNLIEWVGIRSDGSEKTLMTSRHATGTIRVSKKNGNDYAHGEAYMPSPPLDLLIPERFRMPEWVWDHASEAYSRLDVENTFGWLSLRAAESIRAVNINSLAYVKDFIELGKFVKNLTSLNPKAIGDLTKVFDPRKIINGKKLPNRIAASKEGMKQLSNLFLAGHYGLKLTFLDTTEIANAIDRIDREYKYQRLAKESSGEVSVMGYNFEVHRRFSGFVSTLDAPLSSAISGFKARYKEMNSKIQRSLYETDIVPSLSNIWDMVPFSFVVDWVVPLGTYFEARESRDYLTTLPLKVGFYSEKLITEADLVLPKGLMLYGSDEKIRYTMYRRHCRNTFILPDVRFSSVPPTIAKLPNHWLEAAALIISNN